MLVRPRSTHFWAPNLEPFVRAIFIHKQNLPPYLLLHVAIPYVRTRAVGINFPHTHDMNISVPMSLASINISSLYFRGNCENVALGYDVWHNDFVLQQPAEGNWSMTQNYSNNGPGGLPYWSNGPSPEFIHFWRAMLSPGQSATNISDAEIATWTNSTPFYGFFVDDVGDAWPRPDSIDQICENLKAISINRCW